MPSVEAIAGLAKKMGGYDPRLDSADVTERQQAEIEALRTCLIAANSESNGEYDRLRLQLEATEAGHAGQLRNTLAFKAEADNLRALIREVVGADRDWTDAAYALELPSRLAESGWFKRARAALTS